MARQPAPANFLAPIIAENLLDRLTMVTRTFPRALLIGAHDAALAGHLRTLGTFVGDGSLPRLRRAVMTDGVRSIARLHPQIDLAAMGNLLQRVGFTMPVVDVEALTVRYGDWLTLARDLRATGLSSRLAPAPPPLTREESVRIAAAFDSQADPDGRIGEAFRLVHFSGWAPHPDQPQPARRGSGTASLAEALNPKP